ncbi:MAG: hypothetical protein IPI30_11485 [Saprospiraceae bacterium]|nr:hypothetical protein [Candidatus Vicinibacter affinis]
MKERLAETPVIQLSIDPEEICISKTVKFSTTALVGSGITYRWDFGNLSLPRTATGVGPHNVRFSSSGIRNVNLRVMVLILMYPKQLLLYLQSTGSII